MDRGSNVIENCLPPRNCASVTSALIVLIRYIWLVNVSLTFANPVSNRRTLPTKLLTVVNSTKKDTLFRRFDSEKILDTKEPYFFLFYVVIFIVVFKLYSRD